MKKGQTIKYSIIAVLAIASSIHAAEDLGTITVESSTIDDKFDAKKMEVSNTVTLNGEEVDAFQAENIADVLNTVPGVTARKNEGDSNKIHIRGVATENYMGEKPGVAIVIDGVPVQERAGAVNIDMDNIESIKVIKGGASYLYGNDALSGAVVITTKRPKATNEGSVSAEFGSYGFEKYIANYTGGTDKFAYQIQGSYKASDGYWDDSDYWAKSMNGKFQYYIDDTSDITFGADISKRYENDTGSITHTVDGINQVKTNPKSVGEVGYSTDYDIDLSKYFLTYSKDFANDANLMAQLYRYEDTTENKNGAYYNRDLPGSTLRNDHLYDAYANTTQNGFKSEYRQDGDKLAYMIGLDVARNDEDKNSKYRVDYTDRRGNSYNVGDVNSDTSFTEDISALYGEFKYQVNDQLITTLNARYDHMEYDYTNHMARGGAASWEKDFNEQSYRAGLTYKLEENSIIFANISTGFRVPTIDQLYAGDILSGRYDYANNPDIDTEETINYEIGYRGQEGMFTYDIALFQLDRDDMITRNGGNYVSDIASPIMYGNFADARNRGLEFSLNSDMSQTFYFAFNYAYLDAQYTRYDEYNLVLTNPNTGRDYIEGTYDLSGNTVPRTSEHTVYLEGNYNVLSNWLLTVGVNYRSSQYADEMNQVKVDGYSLVDLRTTYNVKVSGVDVELFGKVENLFDEQYFMMPRVTGDRNEDGLYNVGDMGLTVSPGRMFFAGLRVKF
ncbi:TonB-dependent receptor [Sulfurovum sp.]|uniref:TonB-dependent receptor n=1 Tax=Sulfurovum sp. TaxID=1969726 RepID=UPI0028682E97|nr:TonB-dependent receptor [Sulfurovum sp.]